PQDIALPEIDAADEGASLWSDAWHRLAKNKLAIASLWIVAALSLMCFLGPLTRFLPAALRPAGLSYSYEEQNLDSRVTPPDARHRRRIRLRQIGHGLFAAGVDSATAGQDRKRPGPV